MALTKTDAPLTFESAIAELQKVVHELEDGALGLEPSLERFEAGIHLLRNCYRILDEAEQKILVVTGKESDGVPQVAQFEQSAGSPDLEKPAKKSGRRRSAASQDAGCASPEPDDAPTKGQSLF